MIISFKYNKRHLERNEFDVFSRRLSRTLDKAVAEWTHKGLSDKQIEKRREQITTRYKKAVIVNQLNYFSDNMYHISDELKKNVATFVSHNDQIWGECFVRSEVLYEMVCNTYELYRIYVDKRISEDDKKSKYYTYITFASMLGRCCHIYLEILFLLKHGFADGAFARWRSMFEIYCDARFISKYGDDIAKQYIEKISVDKLENTKNMHDWTRGYEKKGNGIEKVLRSDNKIQEKCGIEQEWIDEYKKACMIVHDTPQGTFGRICADRDDIMPVGHSDKGLELAGEHAAKILFEMTKLFLEVYPSDDAEIYLKVMYNWTNWICKSYERTRKMCFDRKKTIEKTKVEL